MHQEMTAAARTLTAGARLTFATGAKVELEGGGVLGFTVEEGADSALLPGAVLSAEMTLDLANDLGQWREGGSLRGERPLIGATAELFLSVGEKKLPCGVFVVLRARLEEGGGRIRLTGMDSISQELTAPFEDSLSYPASLQSVWEHWVGKTRYVWSGVLPNGNAVVDARPEWNGASLRQAAGWIAQAAGCFVRVDREGGLEVVPCLGGAAQALTADAYMSLTDGLRTYGPVTGLEVTPVDGEDPVTVSDGAGERVSIQGNPLFRQGAAGLRALAAGTLGQIKGLTLKQAEFRWRGDPSVGVGSKIALTNTAGETHEYTITRQTLAFDGGFSARCACEVPQDDGAGVMRAITPEGGVNAGALVGTVDGGLLAMGSVTARSIAAQAVTAEKLAAGAVSADHLAAGSVTANSIAAQAVTADKLAAGAMEAASVTALTAHLNDLQAADTKTNQLYAALAHVIELAADSLTAGQLSADQLAAALANFVSLRAATGDFDLATAKNLLADALILKEGVAGGMTISNLAVTSANLLSATLDKLVLRGADGQYYRVFVGSDGAIGVQAQQPSAAEISAGQTADGASIVQTTVNAQTISGQSIKGAQALIAEVFAAALEAKKITASEALIASATIPSLYATAIQAIGDALEFRANELIQLVVGRQEEMLRWFTFDDETGFVIRKPAYTDASGAAHSASIWSTLTDETGYHIKRADLPGYVGSFARDRLIVDGVQLGGGIVARRTSGGGWAWTDA